MTRSHVVEDLSNDHTGSARVALEDAKKASKYVNLAIDLGYLGSDDTGSYAWSAEERIADAVALLQPWAQVKDPSWGNAQLVADLGKANHALRDAAVFLSEARFAASLI